MRSILIVNANAAEAATQRLAELAPRYAAEGTSLTFVGADAGPEGIDTSLDLAISAVEVARIVARERENYDGFVVACGGDPGLDAARYVTTRPVVGIGEAGMLCACPLGATFAVATTVPSDAAHVTELVRRYGLQDRFAGVAALGLDTAEVIKATEEDLLQRLEEACRRAIDERLAEVILLGGSVMIGLEERLSDTLGVPVLASMACGIKIAEALIDLGATTSRAHKYAVAPKRDELRGYNGFQDVYGAERHDRQAR